MHIKDRAESHILPQVLPLKRMPMKIAQTHSPAASSLPAVSEYALPERQAPFPIPPLGYSPPHAVIEFEEGLSRSQTESSCCSIHDTPPALQPSVAPQCLPDHTQIPQSRPSCSDYRIPFCPSHLLPPHASSSSAEIGHSLFSENTPELRLLSA